MNCHGQIWNQSPELAPLWESWDSGRPVPWVRVHRLPDFVFFDHSVHVNHGVGCVTCHGRVDRMARVYQVAPLTMRWCVDCHRDPASHRRPEWLVTAMIPDPVAAVVPGVAPLPPVSPGTDCSTCHR